MAFGPVAATVMGGASTIGWVTNDRESAAGLNAADAQLEARLHASKNLCLAEKVVAIRNAKRDHQAAYDAEASR